MVCQVRILYGWLPGENSKLFKVNASITAEQYNNLADGKLESLQIAPEFELGTKKGIFTRFSVEMQREGVKWDFKLSDSLVIKSGDYSFTAAQLILGTTNTRMISLMANVNAGQFYDGLRFSSTTGINFNFSSSFNLSIRYGINMIRFPERTVNNSLNIHSVNLKALYMLSTKLSDSLLIQYVNTQDEIITNFRLRYNPREGNDFYLVYNDYRGITDRNSIPVTPQYFNRTVMVKYIHTFIL